MVARARPTSRRRRNRSVCAWRCGWPCVCVAMRVVVWRWSSGTAGGVAHAPVSALGSAHVRIALGIEAAWRIEPTEHRVCHDFLLKTNGGQRLLLFLASYLYLRYLHLLRRWLVFSRVLVFSPLHLLRPPFLIILLFVCFVLVTLLYCTITLLQYVLTATGRGLF